MAEQVKEMHVHHGNSVAAWALVTLMTVGSLMVAVAVGMKSMPLALIGAGVTAAGLIVGKVLQSAGYGINSGKGH